MSTSVVRASDAALERFLLSWTEIFGSEEVAAAKAVAISKTASKAAREFAEALRGFILPASCPVTANRLGWTLRHHAGFIQAGLTFDSIYDRHRRQNWLAGSPKARLTMRPRRTAGRSSSLSAQRCMCV